MSTTSIRLKNRRTRDAGVEDGGDRAAHKELSPADWGELLYLAHADRRRAFEVYANHYKESYACVVFNLHVRHRAAGRAKARDEFRLLIDRAAALGGNYYLTYHRWATREQLLACYPQMPEFLRLKLRHDPGELFESDWYRHHRALLAGELKGNDARREV